MFASLHYSTPRRTKTIGGIALLWRMERISINYPEEKVLRLFTTERKVLTPVQINDYLKSLDFGALQRPQS